MVGKTPKLTPARAVIDIPRANLQRQTSVHIVLHLVSDLFTKLLENNPSQIQIDSTAVCKD